MLKIYCIIFKLVYKVTETDVEGISAGVVEGKI